MSQFYLNTVATLNQQALDAYYRQWSFATVPEVGKFASRMTPDIEIHRQAARCGCSGKPPERPVRPRPRAPPNLRPEHQHSPRPEARATGRQPSLGYNIPSCV